MQRLEHADPPPAQGGAHRADQAVPPAALVALVTQGPTTALIVIVLVLVVQQLEGNVLQPILVGRTMDLHPALVIIAVTAGGTLAGITGAFLAVPVVAVAAVTVRYARQQLAEVEPGPGSPPAAAGQPNEEVVHR